MASMSVAVVVCVIRILVGSLCLGVETAYNVPVTPRNTIFLSEGYYYMFRDTDTHTVYAGRIIVITPSGSLATVPPWPFR